MTRFVTISAFVLTATSVLAACVGGGRATEPVQTVTFNDRAFTISSRFDPALDTYYNNVSIANIRLTEGDRDDAVGALITEAGPEFCDGRPMIIRENAPLSAAEGVEYDAESGTFMITSYCG